MTGRPAQFCFTRLQRILVFGGALGALALLGFGCRGGARVVESLPQIELEYWTVWDEPEDFGDLILAYREQHPNVHINVKKFTFDDYENRLLQAWARGEGPDLYSIPNSAVGKYHDFIRPLPATVQLPTLVVTGGCSKDIRVVEQPRATIRPELLDDTFLPVVADDVIVDNTIQALPLAADTLALFYNKDLLTAAKIIAPPQTWQELTDMVDATKGGLTKEENGTLLQSGITLGTADNVNRSVDILSVLMMQSGTQMVDPQGKIVTFDQESATEKGYVPGANALDFYSSFADPGRVTYSWNADQPSAQEAFAAGTAAFFVGYSYQVDIIRRTNPQLNFGLAPLPQIGTDGLQINFANYWVETVATKTEYPNEAWDFLLFATSAQQVPRYLNATSKPSALKALLASQKDDLDLAVFVDQLLLAKTWYHGYNDTAMETSMREMMTSVNTGTPVQEALRLAARRIQETYSKPR
ncbi:MAG: extracellular solute-binding protein [Candidatus Kerfeldbacteria bacterium]|nr:extracellular solute-binding protein [Candidatus Kerfeldbacteria bacterium]